MVSILTTSAPIAPGWGCRLRGEYILTRYLDPAANSNKYRRFIVIWDCDDESNKMLVTHTGRWTERTARGQWNGGTYRFLGFASNAIDKRRTPLQFLDLQADRKRGKYYATNREEVPAGGIRFILEKITLPTTPVSTAHASTVDLTPKLQDELAAALEPPDSEAGATAWARWLWKSAHQGKGTQLEMLGHYARVKDALEFEWSNLRAAESDLREALDRILQLEE